ncbi:MAG: hypothetical protein AAGI14_05290 [Pseudomonadota bacterium]
MYDNEAKSKALKYLRDLEQGNPEVYSELEKFLLENGEDGLTVLNQFIVDQKNSVAHIRPVPDATKLSAFKSDLGPHKAGRVIEFIILYALNELKRSKTRDTLLEILQKAGVPASYEDDYDKALNARLHRMDKDYLISRQERNSITFRIEPAGIARMHNTIKEASTPLMDEYLKIMMPSVDEAIRAVNERGINI